MNTIQDLISSKALDLQLNPQTVEGIADDRYASQECPVHIVRQLLADWQAMHKAVVALRELAAAPARPASYYLNRALSGLAEEMVDHPYGGIYCSEEAALDAVRLALKDAKGGPASA